MPEISEMLWINVFVVGFQLQHNMWKQKEHQNDTNGVNVVVLVKKTPERRWWSSSGVFMVNFEHVSNRFLVFSLLTLKKQMFAGKARKMVQSVNCSCCFFLVKKALFWNKSKDLFNIFTFPPPSPPKILHYDTLNSEGHRKEFSSFSKSSILLWRYVLKLSPLK